MEKEIDTHHYCTRKQNGTTAPSVDEIPSEKGKSTIDIRMRMW
jgi:hypothetical protein